jgi:glycosyltransferase involved in cell wall biosynthesis
MQDMNRPAPTVGIVVPMFNAASTIEETLLREKSGMNKRPSNSSMQDMNRPAPTVGIVVPMFNAASTIEETLVSICSQTYRALDIVVVDDGSKDESAALVSRWEDRDPRVRLCCKQNGGVASARNHDVAMTNAPVLAFVDADDIWAPNKIELQMKALRQHQDAPALVYCWFAVIDELGRTLPFQDQPVFEGDIFHNLCRGNFVGNASSMSMTREVFERVGGFDPSLREGCEDLSRTVSIFRCASPFSWIPAFARKHVRQHGQNAALIPSCCRHVSRPAARIWRPI